MSNLLTITEAANFLRRGKASLYELCRKGIIPNFKIGSRVLVDPEELKKFLKDCERKNKTNGKNK